MVELAVWRFGGVTFFVFAIEISHAGGQSITDKAPLDGRRQVGLLRVTCF